MKKKLFVLDLIIVIVAVLLTFLLVQNWNELKNSLSVLSPAETAVRHAKGMTVAGFHIDPNTIEAIQQVEINDMVLVLVQYSAHRIGGDAELCEMVLEVEKKSLIQWEAKGGSGLCHEINDPDNNNPITLVSSYATSSLLDHGYSTAFGYLRNEQTSKVVVYWKDGLVVPARVSARTYLAAREGGFHVEKIETYNNVGEIIFESDYPNTEKSNP